MQQVGTCTSTYFNELHRSLDECLVQALVYKNALGIFKEEREPEKEKRRLNWTHLIFISCLSFFLSLSLFDVSFFPLPLSLFSKSNLSFFCTYLGRLVGRSIPQLLSDNFILFSICIFHLFFFFECLKRTCSLLVHSCSNQFSSFKTYCSNHAKARSICYTWQD